MSLKNRIYAAIDLKSFYASVECVERGLDPLKTNLVVADVKRTEKTICLAVSPSLKAYGIPGRARLFEVIQKVREVNAQRKKYAPQHIFSDKSYNSDLLKKERSLELDYIAAPPQMAKYMEYSSRIYNIYLKYIAPEDIHVYSIDEVFIDVTDYLYTYKLSARQLTMKIIRDVLKQTGITATAGIGTNMYLCKIAMDIVAKKMPADKDGVRIAQLNEMSYRRQLWSHQPLTDFWRVGSGYAKKLEANGMYTMGDVARCSIGGKYDRLNEDLLYKLFGVNAQFLIDHAWGWEPCTIADVKAYRPQSSSLSTGQVLQSPYTFEKARLIVREMTDLLVLDLVAKGVYTDQIVLTVGYDITSDVENYDGEMTYDHYGRKLPKSAHSSINLGKMTSSTKIIMEKVTELFNRIVNPTLLVRRMYVVANHISRENSVVECEPAQLNFFTDYESQAREKEEEKKRISREHELQKAVLKIKDRYGKNAILKGMNFEEGATTISRNGQVGGHRA